MIRVDIDRTRAAKVKGPPRPLWSAGLGDVGFLPGPYAIHQVAHAMRQHIQIATEARRTGRMRPKTGEEPENIRKIIRPRPAAEQPLDELGCQSQTEGQGERFRP